MEVEELRRFAYLIQCNRCGMWSGYVTQRRRKRPEKINTICSSCHHRLRHTHGTASGNSVTQRYRPKSGGHNRSCSVYRIRPFPDPKKCKSEASEMNRKLKLNKMKQAVRGNAFGKDAIMGFRNRSRK